MQELESILDNPNEMADMYLARKDAALAEFEVRCEPLCSMQHMGTHVMLTAMTQHLITLLPGHVAAA